jgi:hypothetical protein
MPCASQPAAAEPAAETTVSSKRRHQATTLGDLEAAVLHVEDCQEADEAAAYVSRVGPLVKFRKDVQLHNSVRDHQSGTIESLSSRFMAILCDLCESRPSVRIVKVTSQPVISILLPTCDEHGT